MNALLQIDIDTVCLLCCCFCCGFFDTLLSFLGNVGHLTWVMLQQLQDQSYPVLQVHAGSLCFHNPPNSDMDYRIFNVCMWSFLCVRIHTGVGHSDNESAQHFWHFLCSWRGWNLGSLDLKSDAIPVERPAPSPRSVMIDSFAFHAHCLVCRADQSTVKGAGHLRTWTGVGLKTGSPIARGSSTPPPGDASKAEAAL